MRTSAATSVGGNEPPVEPSAGPPTETVPSSSLDCIGGFSRRAELPRKKLTACVESLQLLEYSNTRHCVTRVYEIWCSYATRNEAIVRTAVACSRETADCKRFACAVAKLSHMSRLERASSGCSLREHKAHLFSEQS